MEIDRNRRFFMGKWSLYIMSFPESWGYPNSWKLRLKYGWFSQDFLQNWDHVDPYFVAVQDERGMGLDEVFRPKKDAQVGQI